MENKPILILGGYGNTGRHIARLLLQESNVQLVLAGRNLAKATVLAEELNRAFEGRRVQAACLDASDEAGLKQAFSAMDFVVVASSTVQFTRQIANAAMQAGIGYLDIQVSAQKIDLLKSMAVDIQNAGCCFITDGGFHPGLPALLVRFAAQYYDRLSSARVGSVIKEDWNSFDVEEATVNELVEMLNDFEMSVFKSGRWHKVSLLSTSGYPRMDFGAEFGRQYCAPLMLEEMRALPVLYPSLQETGFFVGGFNWFVDWLIMPIALMAMKLWPQSALKPMGRWMLWGLKKFSKPPYGTMLKLEAMGVKDGQTRPMQVIISHPDGYLFTAIPVTACLLQYLDGSINQPGLWLQALLADPIRMMRDMQRMGIKVIKTGAGSNELEPHGA